MPASPEWAAASRYATDEKALRKGNLWGLPINLLAFCLVAGVTTTAAFTVYGEVLLHPEAISAKFDSWFLALLAARLWRSQQRRRAQAA